MADEGGAFVLAGATVVRFGANTTYIAKTMRGSVKCDNTTFGDPLVGVRKACYTQGAVAAVPHETRIAIEDQEFTVAAETVVKYGADDKFVQKTVSGTGACSNTYFGSDPNVGVAKACYALGPSAANLSSKPPPDRAPRRAPVSRRPISSEIIDAQGSVIAANYIALANAMGQEEGIEHKFGLPASGVTAPTWPMPPHHAVPVRPGTYQYGKWTGDNTDGGAGAYSSNIANVAYIPDGSETGSLNLGVANVSNATYGFRPEVSWALMSGRNGHNASKLRAQGVNIGRPVASARPLGRAGWGLSAVFVTDTGVVYTEGSNTANNLAFLQLPPSFKATAIAVSNSSEFIAVSGWDIVELKGKVAIIAAAGGGDGATLANPDSHKVPKYPKGWWGEWRSIMPGLASLGNIVFMKTIGFMDLDMKAPTSISFTTGKYGASDGVAWGRNPGYMGTGNDVLSWAELSPWTVESNRRGAMPGGGGAYDGLAHRGLIMVASKSEQKVSFIDATPLWAYIESMYLTTPAKFQQTVAVGDGALWPFTFTAAPQQKPMIVKTVSLPGRPTSIQAYAWGTPRAYIGLESGAVQLWNLGNWSPGEIVLTGTTRVGPNPTDIAFPHEKAGASIYAGAIIDYIIVTSRGSRTVQWLRFVGDKGSVVNTLSDSRLVDPIASADGDNHTVEHSILTVVDFAGKAVRNYSYGPVRLSNGYRGAQDHDVPRGSFEYGGEYAVPGRPFAVSTANIP